MALCGFPDPPAVGTAAMTLLSRKADYALLILSHLHRNAEGGNARAIAEQFGLSRPFVANILKELCHAGYVTSHRGVKGGYVLQPAAAGATLAKLLGSIDESFRLTVCTDPGRGDDPCSLVAVCPVKDPLQEIHRRIVDVLTGVTLAQLFAPRPTPAVLDLLPMLPAAAPAGCGSGADPCRSHHAQPATV